MKANDTENKCKTCGGEGKVYALRPKKNTHVLVDCPTCKAREIEELLS